MTPNTTEMVERCARAIAIVQALSPDDWPYFEDEARAAIQAMPINMILDAGHRLAEAAGTLNIATDAIGSLRTEREEVLSALKGWQDAVGQLYTALSETER